MGQFSWLDCKTQEQILDDVWRDVYVLVPKEFGGGHIKEECYDGYGRFGGHDIYELVADWNREHLTSENLVKPKDPEMWSSRECFDCAMKRYEKDCEMLEDFFAGCDDRYMESEYGNDWKRFLGISVGCYDDQNAALKYPIKITHDPDAVYEDCEPSLSDPNQGWLYEE